MRVLHLEDDYNPGHRACDGTADTFVSPVEGEKAKGCDDCTDIAFAAMQS